MSNDMTEPMDRYEYKPKSDARIAKRNEARKEYEDKLKDEDLNPNGLEDFDALLGAILNAKDKPKRKQQRSRRGKPKPPTE
jgi:hypothetical protein